MRSWTMTIAAALVALAGVGAKAPKPATVNVSIKGMKYTPAAVQVRPGDTVVWTNNDDRDHTVVSADGTSFSSGNIGPGATFSFQFTKVGNFAYACSLHPRMRGSVVVQ
jgi:plastocyanin